MHVLIVEDEPVIAQRLVRQISEILADRLTRIKHFDTLDDASDYLADNPVDLVFLDLNLYGEDGFELLKIATAGSFHTIIVSAYAERAITAFEHGVLDFIAKPFAKARLEQAINRLFDATGRNEQGIRKLCIKKTGMIELVEVDTIDHLSASGHYCEVFFDGKCVLHDKPIERIETLLPANFARVHRSHIVNMNKVQRLIIEPGSKYAVELLNGTKLPVGRTRYGEIKQKLQ